MGDTKTFSINDLVTGFKQNNPKTLKFVYKQTYPKVLSFVLKNSGNEAQAKDVFQEAFIACWNNLKDDKFSEDGNVEAYLYAIAKNKWTDYLRSAKYKKTVSVNKITYLAVAEDEDDTNEDLELKQRAILKDAFIKLGDNCKTLLKLFYFERKSMKDISNELKITPATARNNKYRCMEKLKSLSLELKK